jgi:Reverse transcriptase (RNA-dependent DNA polymerase)
MKEEFQALIDNDTWELVPPHVNVNVIECKWVYKVKHKVDGSIERLKTRLVAQGFKQHYGVDYTEMFFPVVKPTTIRTIITVALNNKWSLHQLDVKNTFLHGSLTKEVFMRQPPGYCDKRYPYYLCRLKKAIYGLKQAPRAWFRRFTSFLLELDFNKSTTDPSMFVRKIDKDTLILLLYVDDIIITESSTSTVSILINTLQSEFSMKDLGNLHYFLDVEVHSTSLGLHVPRKICQITPTKA